MAYPHRAGRSTVNEIKFNKLKEWYLLPKEERRPPTETAEAKELGISRITLIAWCKEINPEVTDCRTKDVIQAQNKLASFSKLVSSSKTNPEISDTQNNIELVKQALFEAATIGKNPKAAEIYAKFDSLIKTRDNDTKFSADDYVVIRRKAIEELESQGLLNSELDSEYRGKRTLILEKPDTEVVNEPKSA
jgi:hypothetical protein